MTDEPGGRRPRGGVAALLTLIAPGLGHLYAGAPWATAAVIGALSIAFGAVLNAYFQGIEPFRHALALRLGLPATVTALLIAHAVWTARKATATLPGARRQALHYLAFFAAYGALALAVPFVSKGIDVPDGKSFNVPSVSMEPTIKAGDRVWAERSAYGGKVQPRRGDLIVFRYPKDEHITYVKRVIGIGGDQIETRGAALLVNGAALASYPVADTSELLDIQDDAALKLLFEEEQDGRKRHVMYNMPSARRFTRDGVFTVPADTVFVMGDNRDNTTDSRVWGAVPLTHVEGKVIGVIWSYDKGHFRERLARIGLDLR